MLRSFNSPNWRVSTTLAMLFSVVMLCSSNLALGYTGYSRSDKLQTLKNEYGLSITIPTNWTDPQYGFIVTDKTRVFTFLAIPPTATAKSSMEKLEIYVIKAISNGHVLVCGGSYLRNHISSQLDACSSCTPVDFQTGALVSKPSIGSATFFGQRWFPPSIEQFYESSTDEMIGCQRITAYRTKEHVIAKSSIFRSINESERS